MCMLTWTSTVSSFPNTSTQLTRSDPVKKEADNAAVHTQHNNLGKQRNGWKRNRNAADSSSVAGTKFKLYNGKSINSPHSCLHIHAASRRPIRFVALFPPKTRRNGGREERWCRGEFLPEFVTLSKYGKIMARLCWERGEAAGSAVEGSCHLETGGKVGRGKRGRTWKLQMENKIPW